MLPPLGDDNVDELAVAFGEVVAEEGGSDNEEHFPVVPVDVGVAVDTFKPAKVRGCTVMFDHYSHASGIQRGYIRCPEHDRCFRYVQVNQFPTRTRLCAYLFAWRTLGQAIDRDSHQSRQCQPDERAILAAEGDVELF